MILVGRQVQEVMHHLLDPGILRLTRAALDSVDHVAAAGRMARGADAVLASYSRRGGNHQHCFVRDKEPAREIRFAHR